MLVVNPTESRITRKMDFWSCPWLSGSHRLVWENPFCLWLQPFLPQAGDPGLHKMEEASWLASTRSPLSFPACGWHVSSRFECLLPWLPRHDGLHPWTVLKQILALPGVSFVNVFDHSNNKKRQRWLVSVDHFLESLNQGTREVLDNSLDNFFLNELFIGKGREMGYSPL